MEDNEVKNEAYNGSFPKIEISKGSVLDMLKQVMSYKLEERDLALDKFKKMENESIDELEDMFPKSKQAIDYLRAASTASSYMGDLVKEIMKYAIGDYSGQGATASGQNGESGTGNLIDTNSMSFKMAQIASESLKKLRENNDTQSQQLIDGENKNN